MHQYDGHTVNGISPKLGIMF